MKEDLKIALLYQNHLDFDSRTVYLFDEITEKSALLFIKNLIMLDRTDGEINIQINSVGGNVTDGFAMIDCITKLKNSTYGYVPGRASSMAVDILLSCTTRGMSKNASLMIHSGSIAVEGEITAAMNQAIADGKDLDMSIDIWTKRLKINKKKIKELLTTDTFIYAKDALKYGFVDEIK